MAKTRFPATNGLKVGYYTENLPPDLANFDYFFGCEYSDVVSEPRYCKRVFGSPQEGLFEGCRDPAGALRHKTRFCNFVYSTRIPYRERFFTELGKYRQVAAPGKSMKNCADLSARTSANWQNEKLEYLRDFKFTIAFENSRRIGYVTEKLYDALRADTVPIYWGDPEVATIVNPEALIVVDGDWESDVLPWLRLPERRQPYRPYFREPNLLNRLAGRCNELSEWLQSRVPYKRGFAAAIEEVIALDHDDEAYMKKLSQPRMQDEVVLIRQEYFDFWRKIITDAITRHSV